MDEDRPPAEQPAAGAWPPPTPTTPPPPPPSPTPVVSWGPPPGTAAPVQWAVAEAPVLPPPPGTVYAGVGIRFLAWLLDLVPLLIVGLVLVGPVMVDMLTAMIDAMPAFPAPGQAPSPETEAAMSAALTEAMALAMPGLLRASALFQIVGLFYFAGSWLAFSRSPAMALLGLRIVREEDGGRLSVARVAVRYGGYLLSATPFLLGFAWALFDSRKQAWHDKLAGTVVVRTAPQVTQRTTPWPSPYEAPPQQAQVDPPAPTDASAPGSPAPEPPTLRRPSIGGVAESAWQTFRRSPLDLLAVLAVVLIPALIVLLPLIALYLIAQQDQVVASFQLIGDAFNFSADPESYARFVEYNRRVLASAAPAVLVTALTAFVGSIIAALLVGACAAAVDDKRSLQPAVTVTRGIVRALPALLALGVAAGALFAIQAFLLGLPSLAAASADAATFDPERAALGAVLGAIVLAPLSIYLGAVWLLAVVCVVREELGPIAAIRRAWQLSRGRMRWLIGISVGIALAIFAVLWPIGLLPLGLLAEEYVAGGRTPAALSVVISGLLTLLTAPLICLAYVEAYRAARDDAAAGPASSPP